MSQIVSISRGEKRVKFLCESPSALLILLFVYAALSKLLAFEDFHDQMIQQALPVWMAPWLIWLIPAAELLTAALLLNPEWRYAGFVASAGLMAIFTGYVALALSGTLGKVPCSCGGVLQFMGWKAHLLFNIFFLLLSFTGIYLINRERRTVGNH